MDAETQRQVFDPFFTTKPRRHHRGLGLPTAYAIAQQHGGSITIYSEVGRGTSCRLFLPIEELQPAVPEQPTATAVGQETILIAEDDAALSSVARRILERLGYEVLTAVDGAEALHMFIAGRDHIDLVLLDMAMPRMDGVEAYERIRAIDREVPIAFMTGYSAEMALESFSQSGAVLIPKPFGIDELGETVRMMLDGRDSEPSD
jgi:CheY-like chemotaxis protein